jgi:crossover junction endodeoxyribonuclease RuvC
MRVLGIDPSVRSTGYAVLEELKGKLRVLASGTIINPAKLTQAECYHRIFRELETVIAAHAPTDLAIEGIIYVQNTRTAIALGGARGVALAAAAGGGLVVHEYPAKSIKKAATGFGGAHKQQVGFMMRAMLGLTHTPQADEADALAIALTHIQNRKLALPQKAPVKRLDAKARTSQSRA